MKLTKPLLEKLYLTLHLTGQEIGDKFGITRQAVAYYLNLYNIPRSGEVFHVLCDHCQTSFPITRKRHRRSTHHFCSNPCKGAFYRSDYRTMDKIRQNTIENTLKNMGRKLKSGEFAVQEGKSIKIYPSKIDYNTEQFNKQADNAIKEAEND